MRAVRGYTRGQTGRRHEGSEGCGLDSGCGALDREIFRTVGAQGEEGGSQGCLQGPLAGWLAGWGAKRGAGWVREALVDFTVAMGRPAMVRIPCPYSSTSQPSLTAPREQGVGSPITFQEVSGALGVDAAVPTAEGAVPLLLSSAPRAWVSGSWGKLTLEAHAGETRG